MRGSRLKAWNTKPIASPRSFASPSASTSSTATPFSQYRPALGRDRQPRISSSVDFPEPDGPITLTYSPRPISRSSPRSACTSFSPIA